MLPNNPYDAWYAGEGYYWGRNPSSICNRVIEAIPVRPGFRPRLLDLGCGEGRNAVYFAQHGFEVVGVDASPVGLEKMRRFAKESGVKVDALLADLTEFTPPGAFDVVFSTGALHHLPPAIRQDRFEVFKACTAPGGITAMSVFVQKPFLPPPPDGEPKAHLFRSGELLGHFWDWEILYCVEEVFDCMSSGLPHRHAVNRVLARRPVHESEEAVAVA